MPIKTTLITITATPITTMTITTTSITTEIVILTVMIAIILTTNPTNARGRKQDGQIFRLPKHREKEKPNISV